jgi:molybdopterin converting factor small subunit
LKIEVRLFAYFRNGRDKKCFVEFEEKITPRKVVQTLGIDENDISILLINGRDGKLDDKLVDNDVLSLFPPVGGG